MQELRFVAVSEDGSYAVLAVPGRSGRFILSIDERLRAVAQGQTSRLAQYEIEVESPLRPKEIQARIRAGETAEEIADAAGIPVERVRWFEGPVLAERAYIADQAQAAAVRRAGDSGGSGSRLGDIVPERLTASGGTPEDGQWDSRKRGDGNWQVTLTFPSGGRLHVAEWVFDPRRRHVMPDDDNAARLSLPESELPPEPVALPGEATVTPLAPRLGAAAGMGGGGGGFAGGGSGVGVRSFRPERSVIPDRSLGGDRSLADRPMPSSAAHAPSSPSAGSVAGSVAGSAAGASAAGSGSGSVSERPGMPERTGLAHSPAATPVLPRPAYHDHTDFRDAAAPGAGADGRRGFDASASEEIVPVTAPPYVFDEPAAADDREGSRSRRVVFEEPEPAFLDEQLERGPAASGSPAASAAELPLASASASPSAAPAPAPAPAPVAASAPVAAPVASGAPETRASAGAAPAPTTHSEPVAARPAPRPAPAAPIQAARSASAQEPAARTASAAEVPAAALSAHAEAVSQTPAASAAPAEPGVVAASATGALHAASADKDGASRQAEVAAAAPVAPAPVSAVTAAPAEAPSRVESPARVESAARAESAAESESTASAAADAAHATAQPATAASAKSITTASVEPVSAPTATPAAARAQAVPAAAAAQPDPAAEAKPSPEPEPKPATAPASKSEPAEDQSARQRPAAKKNAKGRRSSVPSWDEIMLGSSRQRD